MGVFISVFDGQLDLALPLFIHVPVVYKAVVSVHYVLSTVLLFPQ